MARKRTGARSFLDGAKELCRFYRMPFFQVGLIAILGELNADEVNSAFIPFCTLVENLVEADDMYNRIDARAEQPGDEDLNVEE